MEKYKKEWGNAPVGETDLRETFSALYDVAEAIILKDHADFLTSGQRHRLEWLLIDVLAEPERFSASLLAKLQKDAMEP